LNDKLVAMGYPIAWWDSEKFIYWVKRVEEFLPPRIPLAFTAAAEHFTAIRAEKILADDDFNAIHGDAEVWNLLKWHAIEELEHKSVAFDVFQTVGGTEKVRQRVMAVMIPLLLLLMRGVLAYSGSKDPDARRRGSMRLVREPTGSTADHCYGELSLSCTSTSGPGSIPMTSTQVHYWSDGKQNSSAPKEPLSATSSNYLTRVTMELRESQAAEIKNAKPARGFRTSPTTGSGYSPHSSVIPVIVF
jgi:hypothetical protein